MPRKIEIKSQFLITKKNWLLAEYRALLLLNPYISNQKLIFCGSIVNPLHGSNHATNHTV